MTTIRIYPHRVTAIGQILYDPTRGKCWQRLQRAMIAIERNDLGGATFAVELARRVATGDETRLCDAVDFLVTTLESDPGGDVLALAVTALSTVDNLLAGG